MIQMFRTVKYFFIVFALFFQACLGQAQNTSTKQAKKDTLIAPAIDNRDLDKISKFIDTALLSRFHPEIEHFNTDDSIHADRQTDIIFSGSSSIRKWESLQNDMQELKVLNRGFGGSTVPEAIYYADVLFFRHQPKKIVFYSGDNDIAYQLWDLTQVFDSYKYFCRVIHSHLPRTKIYIVSLKPSPARIKYWDKMKLLNDSLQIYIKNQSFCEYIDAANCFLDKNGAIKKEYFAPDGVHLNKKGYMVWSDIIYNRIKN